MSSRDSGSRWVRRSLASVLAVMFFAVFLFGSVREAEAATQYKTYYVPTKITETRTSEYGSTSTRSRTFTYFTGSRAGLLKQESISDGQKTVISRNGSGLVTGYKMYSPGGSVMNRIKTTINKGLVKRVRSYYGTGINEKLQMLYTLGYSKGRITKMTMKGSDSNGTVTFRSGGKYSKITMKRSDEYGSQSQSFSFNAKGLPSRVSYSYSSGSYSDKTSMTYKYTYNKKGDPTRITVTGTETEGDGENVRTEKLNYVVTCNYTYKNGNISRCAQTIKSTAPDGSTHTEKMTMTYKYKKVRVKKKYWDMMDGKVPYVPVLYNSLSEITGDGILGMMF